MSGETSRKRGRQRELAVRRVLRTEGWVVYRLAWGCADVGAMRAGFRPMLVQVKSTTRPYEHFGPRDRLALLREAIAADAEPVLAWWPKDGALTMISADEWPDIGQQYVDEVAA